MIRSSVRDNKTKHVASWKSIGINWMSIPRTNPVMSILT